MFKYTFRILSSTKTLIASPENAAQVLSPPQMIEIELLTLKYVRIRAPWAGLLELDRHDFGLGRNRSFDWGGKGTWT